MSTGPSDRSVGRTFLALGLGDVFARVVGFGATIWLARTLGASLYGVVGFSVAVVLYLNRIADGGIELGLGVREVAAGGVTPGALARLVPSVMATRLAIGGGLALTLLAIGLLVPQQPDGVVLALYGLSLVVVGGSSRWIYLGLQRAGKASLARTAGELTTVAIVLLMVRGPGDVARAPLATLAGDSLAALLLLWWLHRDGIDLPVTLDRTVVGPLVPRAVPLVLSALLGLMIYNADLIFLRFFRGVETVGYYAAAYTLISFVSNVGTAYSMSLLPALTRLGAADRDRGALDDTYHTAMEHVFAAGLPVAVGGAMLAPGIIRLVFGADYLPGTTALAVLVWSVPLALLRDVPVMALIARGREDGVLRITAWAAGLNLVLNLVLIPPFGMVGAAAATVATEGVRMIVALVHASREGYALTAPTRFWRPLLAGGALAGALVLAGATTVWVAIPLGGVAYLGVLAVVGGLRVT